VAEKSPTKTKPAIAKNALAASFLAPRAHMQVGEMLQNKNNIELNFQLIKPDMKHSDSLEEFMQL
jgi:hypothetical protein